MILLKSDADVMRLRDAGRVLSLALIAASNECFIGQTTAAISKAVGRVLDEHDAVPVLPVESGFPAVACVSVNDEVAFGVPGKRVLCDGDTVSVDAACRLNGWCCDAARTFRVGDVSDETDRLMACGKSILWHAIETVGSRTTWQAVAADIRSEVRKTGFCLADVGFGHGVGRGLHEDPTLTVSEASLATVGDFELQPGLVLAIEPVLVAKRFETYRDPNGWTLRTVDGGVGVHFEDTVVLTAAGPEVLTR